MYVWQGPILYIHYIYIYSRSNLIDLQPCMFNWWSLQTDFTRAGLDPIKLLLTDDMRQHWQNILKDLIY